MSLSDHVRIARRFQRSIRVDADFDNPQALEGYICPESSSDILLTMARHFQETGHGAFTWTGPYGTGKSSLAVALCAAIGGSTKARALATRVLGKNLSDAIAKAYPSKGKGWRVLPAMGRRAPLADILGEALEGAHLATHGRARWTDERVIGAVRDAFTSQSASHGGLLIIIDELGKVLEGAAHDSHDIFLLQELAELASRSKHRLVVLGILHQSFDEYAQRLAREVRDEWAKIQGRFIDLVVNAGGDEQLELLSRAIETDRRPPAIAPLARAVAENVMAGRAGASRDLPDTLARCWPLHPVTACLLGPLSRRRFGQNQRSLFAFLNSAEPFGLHDFLKNASATALYTPDLLWDYLKANLEPAILASSDGHRWSIAVDAIERCQATSGSPLDLALLKTIALIDLFRERSGLTASRDLLSLCAPPNTPRAKAAKSLEQLQARSFILFRRHLDAYAIFAGSDFDIEAALGAAMPAADALDLGKLRTIADLQPILAKRHYHDTGAMRWFNLDLMPIAQLPELARPYEAPNGAIGRFVLAIPTQKETVQKAARVCQETAQRMPPNTVIGLSPRAWHVIQLARELVAITAIHDHSLELRGDAVARREVVARLADVRTRLEQELARMCDAAEWYRAGESPTRYTVAGLNHLASRIAAERFPGSPRIANELLNREQPSSNAIRAQKDLLRRMIDGEGTPRLGIQGFPAEGGLCDSILLPTGLYRRNKGGIWRFLPPDPKNDPARLKPLWDAALDLLSRSDQSLDLLRRNDHTPVPLADLYKVWRAPPFGVKDGLMPILAVALFLTHRDDLAIYRQGVFQPKIAELDVELLVSDPQQVQLRWMELDEDTQRILRGLANVTTTAQACERAKPIDVARALIADYDRLPAWTKRTTRLPQLTLRVSALFRHAADPNKLLFDDLPGLLGHAATGTKPNDIVSAVRRAVDELKNAYPAMLRDIEEGLLRELEVEGNPAGIKALRERAANMTGISGDFRLNAFIGRLARYEGKLEDIEGIASLANNKRPVDWVDADIDQARLELAQLARAFVRDEAYAHVSNRPDKRLRMAVVVPLQGRPTALQSEFDVTERDREDVLYLIRKVETALEHADPGRKNVILAALAELSARYMQPVNLAPAGPKRRRAQ